MRKKLFIVLTVFLILMVVLSAVVYAADDDLYKNLNETAQQSGNDYFVKYRDNYELDTEEMSFFRPSDAASVILNMLTNFVFLLQKMLGELTISIFSFSLSTNIVEILGGFIEPFITAMKSSLWDSLAIYAIAFAGLVLLIKMAQNRTSQALSSLIGIVIIIVLAFMFYAYPVKMLEGIDTVTSGVSDTVMEGPYKATVGGTAGDAKGKASALCWNLLVHKPWQIIEFGSVEKAQKHEADILKLEPASDEREELVQNLAESEGLFSKSGTYQLGRLGIAIITFLFGLMLAAVLIIFSVLIIGYRFLLLIYIILGIFVFLVALLPNFGLALIRRWGMRVVSVSFTRVIIVFFLSVTMVFMDVIYKFADEYGLVPVMLLMLVTVVTLWFERYRLLDLFTGLRTNGNQLQQNMNRSMELDYNAVKHYRNLRRSAEGKLESINRKLPKKEKPEERLQQQQNDRSNYQNAQNVRFTSSYEPETSQKMQQAGENLRTASEDMGIYFRHAESLLQKQYEYSKVKSEEDAKSKNEPVEYDSFVKRTDGVRAKGLSNFDKGDLTNVANIMRKTVEQGGSINEVISDGREIYREKQQNIQRPESLNTIRNNLNTTELPISYGRKVKAPKGIEYFKTNFGEEQGEEIFLNLRDIYGKEKMANYRPFYNNQGRQSYAQVIKQLDENIQVGKPKNRQRNSFSQAAKKPQKPIKLREGDKRHGNK